MLSLMLSMYRIAATSGLALIFRAHFHRIYVTYDRDVTRLQLVSIKRDGVHSSTIGGLHTLKWRHLVMLGYPIQYFHCRRSQGGAYTLQHRCKLDANCKCLFKRGNFPTSLSSVLHLHTEPSIYTHITAPLIYIYKLPMYAQETIKDGANGGGGEGSRACSIKGCQCPGFKGVEECLQANCGHHFNQRMISDT